MSGGRAEARWLREFRLIPVVLIAAGCLLVLKAIGLLFDGGYTLSQHLGSSGTLVVTTVPVKSSETLRSPATALDMPGRSADGERSWMQEMFSYPDVTGSVGAAAPKGEVKDATKDATKSETRPGEAQPGGGDGAVMPTPQELQQANGTLVPLGPALPASKAERALLERLQARRQELEAKARALELRETLIEAAEKKFEAETAEQKAEQARFEAKAKAKSRNDDVRFKGVVTMYEAMKPKDAAKIFDRLDSKVLLEVASAIKPQRMSEIMAQMSPDIAERLTVELATRGAVERGFDPASLPKIEGRAAANR